ncbi:MAG TPA: ABC transporter substrate-binding protein [Anaerolineae bacterium]|nr:ABC transporter substrate-binding protein [Anaerolineae bacterium]
MKVKLFALIVLILAVLLAACAPQAQKPAPETVRVRLKWLHQVQFAGIYTALKEGYYADENLDVVLDTVDFNQQVSYEKLLSGENDIAIGAPEELITGRSQGKPVRAVAVIFRLNPVVFLAPMEAGITQPADFLNKTIALSPGQVTILYDAMMSRLGLDRSQINEIPSPSYDFQECWQAAAACPDYATNGYARARAEGLDFTAVWPSEYGVPFYGDVLVVTDEYLQQHADVVQRFVRATLKGWQKAGENPELAASATLEFDPELDRVVQLAALKASLPLIDTGEDRLGWMRPEVWQQMHDILLEQHLIEGPFDVSTVYDNQFVEQAYAAR